MTTKLFAYVKVPSGERVLCEVKNILPDPFSLLPKVAVKAVHGAPFNDCNYAIVKMEDSYFAPRTT